MFAIARGAGVTRSGFLHPRCVLGLQHFSSTYQRDRSRPAVERLNQIVEDYPLSASALHLSTSLGTFGLAYIALSAVHFDAPALAVAGIVSRLTKKVRTPLDLSVAAVLANAAPWTNTLRLGPLLGVVKAHPGATPVAEGPFERLLNWAEGPINQYGGPYMMVHWASGLTLVATVTYFVHNGLDIMSLVSQLPFMSADGGTAAIVSEKASCVAMAMVLNTLSLPVRLYLMSTYARPGFVAFTDSHAEFLRGYRAWLRRHLRAKPDSPRRLQRRQSDGGSVGTHEQ